MKKKWIGFILLQVLVLLYIAGSQFMITSYGEEIKLKTAPVDPRDLLYGDYVTLGYEISDIERKFFPENIDIERGDTVYVLLKKQNGYDQLVSVHLKKPDIDSDQHLLKGRVEWGSRVGDDFRSIHVLYGIERYYVPEGTGQELEDKRGQFDVTVKVSPLGQALSDITFIAKDVLTEEEVIEQVDDYLSEYNSPYFIKRTHVQDVYKNERRTVWIVEAEKEGEDPKPYTFVLDAITGEILDVE